MEYSKLDDYVIWFKVILAITCVLTGVLYLNISQTSSLLVYKMDEPVEHNFKILWYNIPPYIRNQKNSMDLEFENCKFSNCRITFNRKEADVSHVVIFDGRLIPRKLSFSRPVGQIWIFAAHESPLSYEVGGGWWHKNNDYIFNWTMTYNKDNTDIYLPYGELLKLKNEVNRDFKSMALSKNKTLLMIASHCETSSKRHEFVSTLKKYVDVEILGQCGKKWNCGVRYKHDDCFQLMGTGYKFYAAFENAFCHQYFTEKVYENFNYDLVMLIRGGSSGEASKIFPAGTYITTEDFKSIKDLGQYLKNLSTDDYAALLKRKSQLYSPGYSTVYQRALCNICERMNCIEKYRKKIVNITQWAYGPKSCHKDTKDI